MTDKYIGISPAGALQEVTGTVTSAGGANAGQLVALDANGKLDSTVMPSGIGADTQSIFASEALSAGDMVNVWNNAGTQNARKADASAAGKQAHGFVLSAVSSGANATVYFEGAVIGLSGMTPGATQFLSATAGGRTETAPATTNYYLQTVGMARTATIMDFSANSPIKRA
jgi:hypothetical protein